MPNCLHEHAAPLRLRPPSWCNVWWPDQERNSELRRWLANESHPHGQRDATLILIAYRHGLRVFELVALPRAPSSTTERNEQQALAKCVVRTRWPIGLVPRALRRPPAFFFFFFFFCMWGNRETFGGSDPESCGRRT